MKDANTAALDAFETGQHLADRAPVEIPDFAYNEDDLIRAGVIKEHRPAVAEIMECFQLGKNGSHEDLLRACAKLERALLMVWSDE